jgi:mannosyltransferase OCH1-like enzyme
VFKVFDDDELDESMHVLSLQLAAAGVIEGAFDAYSALVAPAFRVDIWRAAVVYIHGGIYLDAKMVLTSHYSTWADVHRGTLSLCIDEPANSFYNAMFAAAPKSRALAGILRHMVR